MRTFNITAIAAATLLASGAAAYGQSSKSSASSHSSKEQTVTLVGCLISETDYRQAHGMGKGPLNGAGMGDEFVLVDTSTAPGGAATTASAPPAKGSASTCTERGTGPAYRITGHREEELKGMTGHRLQITGTLKDGAATTTASADTAGKLPPEVDMSAYHEAAATTATPSPAPSASAAPAPSARPNPEPPALSSSGSMASAQQPSQLPRTASPYPLIALVGLLSLGLGSYVCLVPARR